MPASLSTEEFFQAFKTAWVAQSSLSGFGVPAMDARDNPTMPYVEFESMGNVPSGRSNLSEYWTHSFRLKVRDKTPELVQAHVGTIGRAVDTMSLTFTGGGSHIQTKRIGEEYPPREDNFVCLAILVYEVWRRKPRETAPS